MKGRSSRRCQTDWFRLISDFKKFGLTHEDIRIRMSIPVSTLSTWKQGAEPKHSDGERLIDIWCHYSGGSREDIPKTEQNVWWSYHT